MSTRDKTVVIDYYQILGVSRKADTKEIKQAYRRLAKLYHPGRFQFMPWRPQNNHFSLHHVHTKDSHFSNLCNTFSVEKNTSKTIDSNSGKDDSTEKFQLLNRAYEVLKNPRMRMHYDIDGADGLGTSHASDEMTMKKKRKTAAATTSSPFANGFGDGFGDFSANSKRSSNARTVRTEEYEDHTHVEFGDMSDAYFRGKGNGPFNGSGSGSSIPSDQAGRFDREKWVGFKNGNRPPDWRTQAAVNSAAARKTPSGKSKKQQPKSRPFSDERFHGKSPDTKTESSFFGSNHRPTPGSNFGKTIIGEDIRVDWEIDLRKALMGGIETVRVPCKETCSTCEGTGRKPDTEVSICDDCDGIGHTTQTVQTPRGDINAQQKCMKCKGTGEVIEEPCVSCNAQGLKKTTKLVNITVPAFVEDGIMIRMLGEGNPGPNGGPSGDLYVFLWTKDDPTFYRDGDRIYSEESVDFLDAVLGCTVETPYVKFDIPPGTQNDHVVKLKGKGPPKRSNPKERGTHVVTVKVEIPKDLSKEEEKLFMKLKNLRDDKPERKTEDKLDTKKKQKKKKKQAAQK